MWRQIDLRKSKRKQKLVERTQTKLEKATSRQVDQILTFNHLLDTLSKHDQTMTRFQANSSTLHRCLIKWDKLKAHDRSFTRTSIRLALELQSFMSQMDNYFRIPHERPAHHLLQQHRQQQVIVITPSPISLNEAFVEIITAGPSHLRIDDEPSMPNYSATDPQPQPQSHDRSKLGFRKQIVLKYKLGQLRFKTKKFNQKFEDHEARKLRLKLNGNQCIFNMVEDGKTLLELNESIIDLVFHLCLLRNPKR
ncbi:hypothetical protein PtA15_14A140 [Puccinia triticina]|uniref:Uncharacterized protein n=1 Tax=Puccinia triticina TaxID=208348 RepID=A0ABY7D3U9_9BASI|nr:uncharacterized protein PtA15_14A140 [Puccinia triticina]WAQ91258.1 hypothetical protein PtA15_14A140 [Puccinia triticina]WAR62061.1 hypothetical protein PtB15_14B155 [Puccinia triticina]